MATSKRWLGDWTRTFPFPLKKFYFPFFSWNFHLEIKYSIEFTLILQTVRVSVFQLPNEFVICALARPSHRRQMTNEYTNISKCEEHATCLAILMFDRDVIVRLQIETSSIRLREQRTVQLCACTMYVQLLPLINHCEHISLNYFAVYLFIHSFHFSHIVITYWCRSFACSVIVIVIVIIWIRIVVALIL